MFQNQVPTMMESFGISVGIVAAFIICGIEDIFIKKDQEIHIPKLVKQRTSLFVQNQH